MVTTQGEFGKLTLVELHPGVVLDHRYRLIAPLGAGGMGSLFLAEHLQFQRQVAIKVLPKETEDASARQRFVVEARAICHLQHPNIVTYHDFGTDEATGRLYLVLELLRGRDLSKLLAEGRPIPLARTIHILSQLCDALGEAHEAGVVHRDLKPANIMLVKRGDDGDWVKLIDFGIARAQHVGDHGLTGENRIIGTTAYLAPEYISRQEVSPKVDLYAVGVIAYELISGVRPFRGPDAQSVLMAHLTKPPPRLSALGDGRVVPPALDRVLQRALAKDPRARFDSAQQLKQHLLAAARPLLTGESVETTSKQGPPREQFTTAIDFNPPDEDVLSASEAPPTSATVRGRAGVRPTATDIVPPGRRRVWLWTAAAAAGIAAVWLALTRFVDPPQADPAPAAPAPVAQTAAAERRASTPAVGPEPAGRRERATLSLVGWAPPEPRAADLREGPAESRRAPEQPPATVADAPAPVAATPARPRVRLTVAVSPYGDVYLAGRLLGRNRFEAQLHVGRHCFEVRNAGGAQRQVCESIRAGQEMVTLRL